MYLLELQSNGMSSIITTGIVLKFFSDVHALPIYLFILRFPLYLLCSGFGFEIKGTKYQTSVFRRNLL